MEGYYTGNITNIDRETGRVKVVIPSQDNYITNWLPLLAFEWNPPEIEALVGIILDKNGNGCCLGKIFSFSNRPIAESQYRKEISGMSIEKGIDAVSIRFDDFAEITYKGGQMIINADSVCIPGLVKEN